MILEDGLTRRNFLRYATAGGLVAVPLLPFLPETSLINEAHGAAFRFAKDPENLTDEERIHIPKVTMPPVVEDGAQAPIVVEMDHPMEDDDYIKSIQIMNFTDPVVMKGTFYFTPANGEVYFGTQIRLAGGEGTVWVVAECSKHGKWAASKSVKVAAGGC